MMEISAAAAIETTFWAEADFPRGAARWRRGSGGGRGGVRTTIINLRSASRSSLFGRLVISFHLQLISVQKMLDYSLCYRIVLTLCGPNKRPVWHYNDELIVCGILFWIRLLENAWKSIMLKVGFLKIDFVEHCNLIDRIWGTLIRYNLFLLKILLFLIQFDLKFDHLFFTLVCEFICLELFKIII